jgi:hypothetical protein
MNDWTKSWKLSFNPEKCKVHIFACLQFNFKEPDWLFQIRIVNMQKYVDAVVDVCGSGRYTNFLCDSTVR